MGQLRHGSRICLKLERVIVFLDLFYYFQLGRLQRFKIDFVEKRIMYDYSIMKKKHGNHVSQTIDSPILIFDYFELGDAFTALGIIFIFGVLFYSWGIMLVLLFLQLGVGPFVRRRNEKGIFFHWPYKHFGVSLPGLLNPGGRKRYSD